MKNIERIDKFLKEEYGALQEVLLALEAEYSDGEIKEKELNRFLESLEEDDSEEDVFSPFQKSRKNTESIALEKEREKAFHKLEEVKSALNIFQQQLEKAKEDFSKNYENYVEILELAYSAKEVEYDSKLKILKNNFDNEYENHKKEIWDAFQKYIDILDTYYQTVEADFDKQITNISKIVEGIINDSNPQFLKHSIGNFVIFVGN